MCAEVQGESPNALVVAMSAEHSPHPGVGVCLHVFHPSIREHCGVSAHEVKAMLSACLVTTATMTTKPVAAWEEWI